MSQATTPDLTSYDVLAASISGGKDSQTMLRHLVRLAEAAGVRDRIVCIFADLGSEDEWEGTEEIARHHAEVYGLPFIVVRKGEAKGAPVDLLTHIDGRGMFPDRGNRFCTSDLKRDPIGTVFTRLAAAARKADGRKGPARVLNVMGMRAQESPARALLATFERNERCTGKGTAKIVDNWLPIHGMTEDQVWEDIRESGVKYHPVYDEGMPRLSCRFCVLAGRKTLGRAAQLDPQGALKRALLENRFAFRRLHRTQLLIQALGARPELVLVAGKMLKRNYAAGIRFQQGTSMWDIIADAEAATARGEKITPNTVQIG